MITIEIPALDESPNFDDFPSLAIQWDRGALQYRGAVLYSRECIASANRIITAAQEYPAKSHYRKYLMARAMSAIMDATQWDSDLAGACGNKTPRARGVPEECCHAVLA